MTTTGFTATAELMTLPALTIEAMARAGWQNEREAMARVEFILALADEWAADKMPLEEVQRMSSPQERYLVMRLLKPSPTNPAPASFTRLLDALIDATPGKDGANYRTKHGVFTANELAAIGAERVIRGDQETIYFPIAYPGGDPLVIEDGAKRDAYWRDFEASRARKPAGEAKRKHWDDDDE